uniref:Cold-shock domain-containing protein n=1 Tax=Alexandrium andersonii TaxID=327968 RepID=A0A7S2CW83_9DINO|mmetsp:Transcript_44176/g.100351  ORF Transcript_44176/g.100351 Transcript_44176/m.100351 type:complete len:383 (+) Transcript_44176:3-1151(+)
MGMGMGMMSQAEASSGDRLEALVVEWNERGYGFLQVSDGRRAYVHASAFGQGNLTPGDLVNVVVVEDPQCPGKWQAKFLQRGPLGEDGIVIEWNKNSGFGFIQMDDGRRVYVHHSVFGGGDLEVGSRLRVQTRPDARNPGKWCAASVKTEAECAGGLGSAEGGGGRGGRESRPARGQPKERPVGANVLEWDVRGYGFVQTDEGRRVYVHHSSFGSGNLDVGERVSVVIVPDQRNPGKLSAQSLARDGGIAAEVALLEDGNDGSETQSFDPSAPFSLPAKKGMSEGLDSAASPLEEWHSGTVVQWQEDRGFGFIELSDGRRLYVHHSAFGGGSLLQDGKCEAQVAPDRVNPGKWSATAVRGEAVVPRSDGFGGEPAAKRHRSF